MSTRIDTGVAANGAPPAEHRADEDASPAPPAAPAEARASAVLSPALREMMEAVRRTAEYVVSTGQRGRVSLRSSKDRADPTAPGTDAEEAVHDFRVALRRLRTVLRPLRRVYGRSKLRKIGAGLKRYADATGVLRDEEVLRETMAALPLPNDVRLRVDAWCARRMRQERTYRARVVRLLSSDLGDSGDLERELGRLEKRLRKSRCKQSLAEVASRAMLRAHRDLGLTLDAHGAVDTAALDTAGAMAMHTLRIRFKRLRYTAELFGPLLEAAGENGPGPTGLIEPRELATRSKDAARMQKRLGELHDVDEALVRIGRAWGLDVRARAAVTEALRAERERLVTRALAELSRWVVPRVG